MASLNSLAHLLIYFSFFSETGFICVALAILEPTLSTRLASNSGPYPSTGIKAVCYQAWGLFMQLSTDPCKAALLFFFCL